MPKDQLGFTSRLVFNESPRKPDATTLELSFTVKAGDAAGTYRLTQLNVNTAEPVAITEVYATVPDLSITIKNPESYPKPGLTGADSGKGRAGSDVCEGISAQGASCCAAVGQAPAATG